MRLATPPPLGHHRGMLINAAVAAFLLAFPALFSIVNPVGTALIFGEVTADRSHADRTYLAGRIGLYGLGVMLVSLWAGSYVLNFFGVSLGALRIAGGLVVAIRAWGLLMAPAQHEERKHDQAAAADAAAAPGPPDEIAFFPLTMPFTTGPGTISVAIALGSERPGVGAELLPFFLGVTLAAMAMALIIWLAFRSADRLFHLLGDVGARIVTRLAAFLLLCIGVQILVNGVEDVVRPLLARG